MHLQEGRKQGCTQLDILHRLRKEMNSLFSNMFLKGKVIVTAINLPDEIEIVLKIGCKNNFTFQKQITLIFMFGNKYPEDPPFVSFGCDSFLSNKDEINLIDEESWVPTITLSQIILKINGMIEAKVESSFLFSNLPKKSSQLQTVSQHFYFPIANDRLQNQNSFAKYLTAASAFKPLQSEVLQLSQLSIQEIDNDEQEIRQVRSVTNTNSSKKEKLIKKEAKPMNKNANLPKFLIRIFIKYIDRFRDFYEKKQFDKLMHQCKKMKEWKRSDKKQHAFGLKHLKRFFQNEQNGYPHPEMNRKVISRIMEKFLLEQICQNSQIPANHKVGYLSACRVYSIRCRNSVLAGRIQSK